MQKYALVTCLKHQTHPRINSLSVDKAAARLEVPKNFHYTPMHSVYFRATYAILPRLFDGYMPALCMQYA